MGDSLIASTFSLAYLTARSISIAWISKWYFLHSFAWVQCLAGHQVMVATDNIIVVSYINKQSGTQSHSLLWLVVDLFLCLHSQDIVL